MTGVINAGVVCFCTLDGGLQVHEQEGGNQRPRGRLGSLITLVVRGTRHADVRQFAGSVEAMCQWEANGGQLAQQHRVDENSCCPFRDAAL